MKKFLLSLILITSTNQLTAQQSSTDCTLTQKESDILTSLHDKYIQDKLFYKKLSDADLVLSLDILQKKIKSLNKETFSEHSRSLKAFLISFGLTPMAVSLCCAALLVQDLYESYIQFISGKFKDVNLPFSIIKRLASKTITDEEKQYLKRFSFENLYFEYTKDPFAYKLVTDPKTGWPCHITQEEAMQNTLAKLSPAQQEKINYLALRSAITDLKIGALVEVGFIAMTLTAGALYSAGFFYGAYEHEVKIQEKIKLNKKLYTLLKNEEESKRLLA